MVPPCNIQERFVKHERLDITINLMNYIHFGAQTESFGRVLIAVDLGRWNEVILKRSIPSIRPSWAICLSSSTW